MATTKRAAKQKQPPLIRIRLDPKLVARLEKAREKNGATLTGEIAERLEESFRVDPEKETLKNVIATIRFLAEDKDTADLLMNLARMLRENPDWYKTASDAADFSRDLIVAFEKEASRMVQINKALSSKIRIEFISEGDDQ